MVNKHLLIINIINCQECMKSHKLLKVLSLEALVIRTCKINEVIGLKMWQIAD